MVTIKDISNKLGISISSVSKALNGATDISKKTRDKVIEVANDMGYIKKSSLKNSSLKFGIIIDEDLNDYYKNLSYDSILGFNKGVVSEGNSISVLSFKDTGKRICFDTMIKLNNLFGAVIFTNNISENFKNAISRTNSPMVLVNNNLNIDKQNIVYVGIDVVEGMRSIVDYFIQKNHREIAFINVEEKNSLYQDKIVGYIASITSGGLKYNPDNVLNVLKENFDKEVIDFIKNKNIKAICADSDLTAYRIVNIVKSNGYKVPEDIKVIGFDDSFLSIYSNPEISTISYDKYELGIKAYKALKNILNGNIINKVQVKATLIERKSSN